MSEKDSARRAAVDQSSEVRDPGDDSDLVNDPAALVDTYPEAFDRQIEQGEAAIAAEAGTGHSPSEPDRSTDNARPDQFEPSE